MLEEGKQRVVVEVEATGCPSSGQTGNTVDISLQEPVGTRTVIVQGHAIPVLVGCNGRLDETQRYDGCEEGAPPPP